jgi:protease I
MADLSEIRVAVLATDGFEEQELTEPVQALKDAGAQVTIVSLKPGEIPAVRHDTKTIRLKVDRTIQDVRADDFDAVELPGGGQLVDLGNVILIGAKDLGRGVCRDSSLRSE